MSVLGGKTQVSMRRFVLMLIGCACLWLCLKSVSPALLRGLHGGLFSSDIVSVGLYMLYAIVLVGVALATARLASHARTTRADMAASIVGMVCGTVGLALLLSKASTPVVLAVSLVFTGVFVGMFVSMWGIRLASLPPSVVPLLVALSYALTEFVQFALSALSASLVNVACPLVSLLMLAACPLDDREAIPAEHASLSSMAWGMVLTCAGLIALWSFALGMLPQGSGGVLSKNDLMWSYCFSCIVLLAMAAFFWFVSRRGHMTRQQFLYPFTAIVVVYLFIITGMLAMQSDDFVVFKRVFVAIAQCLEAFAVILIVYGAAERKVSPVSALALFIAFLGCELWMVVSGVVQASGVFEGSLVGEWTAVGLSLVTSVVLILYLLRSATVATAKGEVDAEAAQRSRCEKASAAHGLSKKEQEVAQLLYRGLSAKRIAEELYISENTVRSHTSNIYHKLGVHSKQELMQLFDGYDD